ncbi:hypothetical protein AWJ20_5229 [Sugiyamaella lignohabitans]|uniref:Inosine/uridine-preferring nucleoside hydrolase domain-containing protein n=1 Tax=Sugiyamaella lignohabitans TaxID=796027 RepID=A0A161HLK3_9ASCO|nr:uncharacterized protein AWJ20_5229 [Sugiyamaella lignohabitans]ANB14267.1 hypothetical protein AWJ20_5229 [Sugiyamaella lignohabitans]
MHNAEEVHGWDGLGNVHELAKEYTATQEWIDLFKKEEQAMHSTIEEELSFIPSRRPSYLEILDILRENEPGTVIICAIGPLMNLAMAAQIDPITFSRVKKVVSMGGALLEPGNVTPTAEFNVFSDPAAAAIVYALSSPSPEATLPENTPESLLKYVKSPDYKPISLIIVPLDITHRHFLNESTFAEKSKPLIDQQSPLALWMSIWMGTSFDSMRQINAPGVPTLVHMHDPLAVWYAITYESNDNWKIDSQLDIRVETVGRWTSGSLLVDRRGRRKTDKPTHNDRGQWLLSTVGNRVDVCVDSPGHGEAFGKELLDMIFH